MANLTKIFYSDSAEATRTLAELLAGALSVGDVLLLEGTVGSGKTHFARSVIQFRMGKVGLREDVPSPTYTIVQTYDDGLAEFWHADLYRLSSPSEIQELGFFEAFSDAICLIEWPERLGAFKPANALTIHFAAAGQEDQRIISMSGSPERWGEVLALLGENANV